jgi:hypothetical protein
MTVVGSLALWYVVSTGLILAFALWVIGFGVLGALVALASPFRWSGLLLGAMGLGVGAWLGLQLASADDALASLIVESTFAAGLPMLVGFLLAARRLGWFGPGVDRDPHAAHLAHASPVGFPYDLIDAKRTRDDP